MRRPKTSIPLGPSLASGIGLLLAVAAAFSSPEGAPVGGMAMRVWVPLPDWLVFGAVATVSIASLTFIALGLSWRRRRKSGDDNHEQYQEAEKVPNLFKIILVLLALTPAAMMGGAIFWLSQSSSVPALVGSVGADRFDEPHAIEEAAIRPASSV